VSMLYQHSIQIYDRTSQTPVLTVVPSAWRYPWLPVRRDGQGSAAGRFPEPDGGWRRVPPWRPAWKGSSHSPGTPCSPTGGAGPAGTRRGLAARGLLSQRRAPAWAV